MKTLFHPANARGHADHGWLNAWHSFSFADYHDPQKVHFGLLRVLNDDTVAPGMGFGTHPHDNMEIVTIPLEGATILRLNRCVYFRSGCFQKYGTLFPVMISVAFLLLTGRTAGRWWPAGRLYRKPCRSIRMLISPWPTWMEERHSHIL